MTILPSLLALLLGTAAPAQDGPGLTDSTPSDPAALGFLSGYADERMLNLPAQGVVGVEGVARVLMTSAVGAQTRVTFTLGADFTTGRVMVQAVNPPPDLLPQWAGVAQQAATTLVEAQTPLSQLASAYVVTLSREEDLVRLRFRPRDTKNPYRLSLWFQADGTLERREEQEILAAGEAPVDSVTRLTVEEGDGRTRIVRAEKSLGSLSCTTRYEYEKQGGVLVLKKVHVDGVLDLDQKTRRPFRQPITVDVEYEVSLKVVAGD